MLKPSQRAAEAITSLLRSNGKATLLELRQAARKTGISDGAFRNAFDSLLHKGVVLRDSEARWFHTYKVNLLEQPRVECIPVARKQLPASGINAITSSEKPGKGISRIAQAADLVSALLWDNSVLPRAVIIKEGKDKHLPRSLINKALKRLCDEDVIRCHTDGAGCHIYRINPFPRQ